MAPCIVSLMTAPSGLTFVPPLLSCVRASLPTASPTPPSGLAHPLSVTPGVIADASGDDVASRRDALCEELSLATSLLSTLTKNLPQSDMRMVELSSPWSPHSARASPDPDIRIGLSFWAVLGLTICFIEGGGEGEGRRNVPQSDIRTAPDSFLRGLVGEEDGDAMSSLLDRGVAGACAG